MSTLTQFFSASGAPQIPVGSDLSITGNIIGLLLSKSGPNEVTVSPGTCKNSDETAELLTLTAATCAVPATADTVHNIFLCEDGQVRADTDSDGVNITQRKRWLGFVYNEGTEIADFFFFPDGNHMCFKKPIHLVDVRSGAWDAIGTSKDFNFNKYKPDTYRVYQVALTFTISTSGRVAVIGKGSNIVLGASQQKIGSQPTTFGPICEDMFVAKGSAHTGSGGTQHVFLSGFGFIR